MTPEDRKKKYPYWERDCLKCGAPLCFAVNSATSKIIPIDLRAEVYAIVYEKTFTRGVTVTRTTLAFVSHFRTCTDPDNVKKRTEESSTA